MKFNWLKKYNSFYTKHVDLRFYGLRGKTSLTECQETMNFYNWIKIYKYSTPSMHLPILCDREFLNNSFFILITEFKND